MSCTFFPSHSWEKSYSYFICSSSRTYFCTGRQVPSWCTLGLNTYTAEQMLWYAFYLNRMLAISAVWPPDGVGLKEVAHGQARQVDMYGT